MAKRKIKCPKCDGIKTKYLDKAIRETPHGERYEKIYECKTCGEMFYVPIETTYGEGTRKAKR